MLVMHFSYFRRLKGAAKWLSQRKVNAIFLFNVFLQSKLSSGIAHHVCVCMINARNRFGFYMRVKKKLNLKCIWNGSSFGWYGMYHMDCIALYDVITSPNGNLAHSKLFEHWGIVMVKFTFSHLCVCHYCETTTFTPTNGLDRATHILIVSQIRWGTQFVWWHRAPHYYYYHHYYQQRVAKQSLLFPGYNCAILPLIAYLMYVRASYASASFSLSLSQEGISINLSIWLCF